MINKHRLMKYYFILFIALLILLPFSQSEHQLSVDASSKSATEERGKTSLEEIELEQLRKEKLIDEADLQRKKEALLDEIGFDELDEDASLEEKIDTILQSERLDGALAGISIRNAHTSARLYSHVGDVRLHPASNMKVLTSVAALDVLGEDYQFTTEVLTDGKLAGKVLQGNVYLKGKGDPTLVKEDFVQFAKDLKAQGIHKINGDLIGDDQWYDDIRLPQDVPWSDEAYYYGAQVSALTMSPNDDYDTGSVIVEVHPGPKVGEKSHVKLVPETDTITIINRTETVGKDDARKITIDRQHGTNTMIIEGQIPLKGSETRVWRSVWDPTQYALDVFKKALEENGIQWIGTSTQRAAVTPEKATVLTSKKSIPLKELLIPFMKLSNNGIGEILTKEMGQVVYGEGSWDKGLQVIEEVIDDIGVDVNTVFLRDGSGISDKNLLPADELSLLLVKVQDQSWFPVFQNSLPVAGEPDRLIGGTLRNRMTDDSTKGNVKAKTGSLTGVSALSVYVTAKDGEELTFSLIFNHYVGGSVTAIEDVIATVLAEHEFNEE